MKKIINILLSLIFLFAINGFAQDRTDFEVKLKKLEQDITKLQRVAERYHRQRELALLAKAYGEYLAAERNYNLGKYQLAKFHYVKAQNIVVLVAKNLVFKPAAKMKSELKVKIEKAERLINKNQTNEEGRYLLSKARLYQQKMDENLQKNDYRNAFKFYKISNYFANRILQLFTNGNINISPAERYKMVANNIKKLYREVNSDFSLKNKNTKTIISKVDKLLMQASISYEKGEYRKAFANLQIVEKLLYRIIDLNNSNSVLSENDLKSDLFSLNRYLDTIEKKVKINNNSLQISLINKAKKYALAAERDIAAGEYNTAKKKIMIARKIAGKTLQLQLSNETDYSNLVQRRLSEVTRLFRLQENRINEVQNSTITYMQQEIRVLLKKADELAQDGNAKAAFYNIQLALKFINSIQLQIDKGGVKSLSKEILLQQINEVEKSISQLSNEHNNEKIRVLNDLLIKAKKNYDSGKYTIAMEFVRIIKNQIQMLSH